MAKYPDQIRITPGTIFGEVNTSSREESRKWYHMEEEEEEEGTEEEQCDRRWVSLFASPPRSSLPPFAVWIVVVQKQRDTRTGSESFPWNLNYSGHSAVIFFCNKRVHCLVVDDAKIIFWPLRGRHCHGEAGISRRECHANDPIWVPQGHTPLCVNREDIAQNTSKKCARSFF